MKAQTMIISILDDRKGARETLRNGIQPALPHDWHCIICPLQDDPSKYSEWLQKNGVSILILDQLLNEQEQDSELPVTYKGDEVIKHIRNATPDFPIIVVTSNLDDEDLQNAFGAADDIVDRTELLEKIDKYIPRFERIASIYSSRNAEQLARLAELAEKAATGLASQEDMTQLKAIQHTLALPCTEIRSDVALDELEQKLKELESLEQELKTHMKRK
jgi:CheY-like chemotaxis protein